MTRAPRIFLTFAAPAILWQVVAFLGDSPWLRARAAAIVACVVAVVWASRSSGTLPRLLASTLVAGLFWAGALEATVRRASLLGWELSFFAAGAAVHAAGLLWTTALPEAGRIDRLVRRMTLALAALVVALFVLEGACRTAFGLHTYDPLSDDPGRGSCFYRGPDRRPRAIPGYRGRYVHRDFPGVRVEINDWGLRDGQDEATPPRDGEAAVIVVGDSFAYGLGVPLENTFQQRLQAMGEDVRVFGAGIPGYGTSHQRHMVEDLLTVVSPAVVVVALFEGNDFQDTAWADLGDAVPTPPPGNAPPPAARDPVRRLADLAQQRTFWMESSALLQVGSPRGTGLPSVFMKNALAGELSEEQRAMVDGAFAELALIRDRCEGVGAELAVLLVPSSVQAEPQRFEHYVARQLGADPADFARTAFHDELAARLAEEGYRVVDPLPGIEAAALAGEPCYHPEGHWNAAGHREAAEALRAPVFESLD